MGLAMKPHIKKLVSVANSLASALEEFGDRFFCGGYGVIHSEGLLTTGILIQEFIQEGAGSPYLARLWGVLPVPFMRKKPL